LRCLLLGLLRHRRIALLEKLVHKLPALLLLLLLFLLPLPLPLPLG